jgi:hypothetical protein
MSNGETIRNPLGWPPGSVRGMLSLLIAIQFWLLLLLPDSKAVPVPINLYLMLTLVGVFLISHGRSIATASDPTPSPLYLPGGTLRVLIIGGTIAVVAYLYANFPERLTDRMKPARDQLAAWPTIVGAYIGGFVLGYIFRIMPFRNNWLFQAFLAWLSMIAMAMLFIEIIIQAFINPTLPEKFDLSTWAAVVTGIVSCYYGTRS